MFVAITNTPRDYAWGSTTAIPSLWGMPVTGLPQAELWLGTHPGSPARTPTGSLVEIAESRQVAHGVRNRPKPAQRAKRRQREDELRLVQLVAIIAIWRI